MWWCDACICSYNFCFLLTLMNRSGSSEGVRESIYVVALRTGNLGSSLECILYGFKARELQHFSSFRCGASQRCGGSSFSKACYAKGPLFLSSADNSGHKKYSRTRRFLHEDQMSGKAAWFTVVSSTTKHNEGREAIPIPLYGVDHLRRNVAYL